MPAGAAFQSRRTLEARRSPAVGRQKKLLISGRLESVQRISFSVALSTSAVFLSFLFVFRAKIDSVYQLVNRIGKQEIRLRVGWRSRTREHSEAGSRRSVCSGPRSTLEAPSLGASEREQLQPPLRPACAVPERAVFAAAQCRPTHSLARRGAQRTARRRTQAADGPPPPSRPTLTPSDARHRRQCSISRRRSPRRARLQGGDSTPSSRHCERRAAGACCSPRSRFDYGAERPVSPTNASHTHTHGRSPVCRC